MRERLVLFAVLVAATMLAALLVFSRADRDRRDLGAAAPLLDGGELARDASSAGTEPSSTPLPFPDGAAPDAGTARPASDQLPDYVHVDPRSSDVCGDGMVLVDGIYCPYVGHTCSRFLDEEHDVCQRYAPDVLCEGRLTHRRFCIDVFEYPNLAGTVPVVMVDWNDAGRACAVEGKRLCTVEEWEFACEGPQMWPYPYGTERDPTACNIDRPYTLPDLAAFGDPAKISAEVERLDKRVPSGSEARCISPFGVRDMTGNVDEWVHNERGGTLDKPYRSTLKGGYWGPIRARCRPITSTHNAWFSFYQVGFRCCQDTKDGTAVEAAPPGAVIPKKQRMAEPPEPPTP